MEAIHSKVYTITDYTQFSLLHKLIDTEMEKGITRHEHSNNKRVKNKQNRTSLNSNSGSGEKKKLASKENTVKIKINKLRHGNVRDFQGRRQDSRESNGKSIWLETTKEVPQKSLKIFNEKPVTLLTKKKSNPSKEPVFNSKTPLKGSKKSPADDDNEEKLVKFNFDDHMGKWAEQLCQPLVVPSTNVEFEIPYVYSEEFYSKLSAKSYMMQPFSSVEEPEPTSNSYVDEWYEKAQLARQYYRQLCVQPSRVPIQMITIKRTVAQFVAEECALLGTELYFEEGSNIIETIGIGGKKKQTIYIVSNNLMQKKIEAVEAQIKTESSIYTESWQN